MQTKDAEPSEARAQADSTTTRIISREAVCDGVRFSWWAVGERPALVTVSSSSFGSVNGFTDSDPEVFAVELLRKLIPEGALEAERGKAGGDSSCLSKPGWFEKS